MAIYDYQCETCGNTQEESHPMSGPKEIIICSKCNSKKIKKIVSIPYIRFIGDWQTNNVRKI